MIGGRDASAVLGSLEKASLGLDVIFGFSPAIFESNLFLAILFIRLWPCFSGEFERLVDSVERALRLGC